MTDWPTLTRVESFTNFNETLAYDPTLKSRSESGYSVRRQQALYPKKRWSIYIKGLTLADVHTLNAFQKTMGVGAGEFYWTPTKLGITYLVYLAEPLSFRQIENDQDTWQCWAVFEESSGGYTLGLYGSGPYGY